MKKWILLAGIIIVLMGCKKERLDVGNPDVERFVQQLKNGTFNLYERNEKGERLWLQTPRFGPEHIAALIALSKDTTHIQKFPTNPMSSRSPFPEGRNYFILGECLLWLVNGVRGASSLAPYLIDTSKGVNERYKGITSTEILMLSNRYRQWWSEYKNGDWKTNSALSGTSYIWM
ncbi:DUF4943 domain-containing protein [Niabella sp. CC-SYL272]|uniref:DUF4943 family protein n=1 Tax=Niabella agricola TaxID=2891571 RepID=UPI001F4035D7|nr:DUF4943 family protein [Niabella agricola]MCF3111729.1 DUF4943 domain-containing protein [Niabella agricola]